MKILDGTLLLADISGYSNLLERHGILHAQEVVTALLEAMIAEASDEFLLNKIEGDALLFYSTGQDVERAVSFCHHMHRAFHRARARLERDHQNCENGFCPHIHTLAVKFLIHTGRFTVHFVYRRFEELLGKDVIIVHRLLKNSVPLTSYVLLTEPAWRTSEPAPMEREEVIEPFGTIRVRVYPLPVASQSGPG